MPPSSILPSHPLAVVIKLSPSSSYRRRRRCTPVIIVAPPPSSSLHCRRCRQPLPSRPPSRPLSFVPSSILRRRRGFRRTAAAPARHCRRATASSSCCRRRRRRHRLPLPLPLPPSNPWAAKASVDQECSQRREASSLCELYQMRLLKNAATRLQQKTLTGTCTS